jgi:hypothetical protein
MSETKFPYFHGIALLQLSEVDIGCNNDNIGLLSVIRVALIVDFCVMFGR